MQPEQSQPFALNSLFKPKGPSVHDRLSQAWGVANDAAKMLVAEGLPGITSNKPIPSTWNDALSAGVQDRGTALNEQLTYHPEDPTKGLGETAMGFAGGTAPQKVGSEAASIVSTVAPKVFEGFSDLSTKLLENLKGKSTVSKQFISDLTNASDLKQTEKDLIRKMLDEEKIVYHGTTPENAKGIKDKGFRGERAFVTDDYEEALDYTRGIGIDDANVSRPDGVVAFKIKKDTPLSGEEGKELFTGETAYNPKDMIFSGIGRQSDQVDVPTFAEKVRAELLPLKRQGIQGPKYESVSLPDELRGPVSNYKEHVYQSPIETSAGNVHFSGADVITDDGIDGANNYFGHTRVEDLPDNGTRRVIEVQSDLFQKGRLEKALDDVRNDPEAGALELSREKELSKLEPYKNNAAHFRMIREEVKQAALDGKTKLQFPTGETAMKIEGLGDNTSWTLDGSGPMSIDELAPGREVFQATDEIVDEDNAWIITDVLGDGKFKAVSKRYYESTDTLDITDGKVMQKGFNTKTQKHGTFEIPESEKETFDISGKVDTENPIYKFYEKEVGKYLKNKYNAQLVTDPQGVKWWEIPVAAEEAKKPVLAYGKAELGTVGGIAGATAIPAVVGATAAMDKAGTTEFVRDEDGAMKPTQQTAAAAQALPKEAPTPAPRTDVFVDPVRNVEINDDDIEELRRILYSEIGNRSQEKRALEAKVVINTALNRLAENKKHNRGPQTLADVLRQKNQYQGLGTKQYDIAASGKGNVKKMEAIDDVLAALVRGEIQDTTNGAFYYIHNPDETITYDDQRKLYK